MRILGMFLLFKCKVLFMGILLMMIISLVLWFGKIFGMNCMNNFRKVFKKELKFFVVVKC